MSLNLKEAIADLRFDRPGVRVEPMGFEPTTPWLQHCSDPVEPSAVQDAACSWRRSPG